LSKCPFYPQSIESFAYISKRYTCLGRLFADDTSIGHIANDKDSLQDLVNLDLAYLNDWSKRWLVKFNQHRVSKALLISANVTLVNCLLSKASKIL
jgi:hypothetical protein